MSTPPSLRWEGARRPVRTPDWAREDPPPPRQRKSGLDRHQDQQSDWDAGRLAAPLPPRRRLTAKRLGLGGLVSLLVGGTALGLAYHYRLVGRAQQATRNEVLAVQTQLELTVVARLVRDFRVAEGRYPSNLLGFLKSRLKVNKSTPPGHDFWGTAYRLEIGSDGFVVYSAGPDRRHRTADDLSVQASVRESN